MRMDIMKMVERFMTCKDLCKGYKIFFLPLETSKCL